MKTFYRRHLPHWQPDGAVIFITFRLYASLPRTALEKIIRLRESIEIEEEKGKTPPEDIMQRAQRLFDFMDECLDQELLHKDSGSPCWLEKPEISEIIRNAMRYYEGKRFCEHRYVIMPNHVHWLIEPFPINEKEAPGGRQNERHFFPIASILKSVKGYSGKEANRILGRNGAFWQDESYDRWIRDRGDYNNIIEYIDANPVKAGLCEKQENWQWSSAGEQIQWDGSPDPSTERD